MVLLGHSHTHIVSWHLVTHRKKNEDRRKTSLCPNSPKKKREVVEVVGVGGTKCSYSLYTSGNTGTDWGCFTSANTKISFYQGWGWGGRLDEWAGEGGPSSAQPLRKHKAPSTKLPTRHIDIHTLAQGAHMLGHTLSINGSLVYYRGGW